MAYQGYLISFNTGILPMKYMATQSYIITPNQRIDLDSGVSNANGILVRNVLEHTRSKIEWNTPAMLNNKDIAALNSFLRENYENWKERRIAATYYDVETDSYKTGTFYMPDVQYTIYRADNEKKILYYNKARFALIEY